MIKTSNTIRLLFIIPFVFIIYILLAKNDEYIIYPNYTEYYLAKNFDTEYNTNINIISLEEKNKQIFLKKMLRQEKQIRYTSLSFNYIDNNGIDISKFKNLNIEVRSPDTEEIEVRLCFHIEGISDKEKYESYIIKSQTVKINNQFNRYSLNLAQFNIPEWYYYMLAEKKQTMIVFEEPSILNNIIVYPSINHPAGNEAHIEINEISLTRYSPSFFTNCYFLLTLYYIVLIVFLLFNKPLQLNIKKFFLFQKHSTISKAKNPDLYRLIHFIQDNFNDSNLSIREVADKTGISSRDISFMIKNHLGYSFKQYLNLLRIEEAKHLIETTDRQISEIAYFVGFNNPIHFYRIFKEIVNLSPKEYLIKTRK
ncbi:MAG: AraC family transcriptional regulator [Spirochaetes bacterium]|nr:AraC family transcriptional regulator [Spirochaetota bacterium]